MPFATAIVAPETVARGLSEADWLGSGLDARFSLDDEACSGAFAGRTRRDILDPDATKRRSLGEARRARHPRRQHLGPIGASESRRYVRMRGRRQPEISISPGRPG
jgi:hypothetical protein